MDSLPTTSGDLSSLDSSFFDDTTTLGLDVQSSFSNATQIVSSISYSSKEITVCDVWNCPIDTHLEPKRSKFIAKFGEVKLQLCTKCNQMVPNTAITKCQACDDAACIYCRVYKVETGEYKKCHKCMTSVSKVLLKFWMNCALAHRADFGIRRIPNKCTKFGIFDSDRILTNSDTSREVTIETATSWTSLLLSEDSTLVDVPLSLSDLTLRPRSDDYYEIRLEKKRVYKTVCFISVALATLLFACVR
ncbi:hypothetical protein Tcan_06191 [Toxocara canis]|uniref:Uncharacterized protein n=1 Tax=Toxocara canis TaxID=6265 RepID=A0A0B2W527_TOXCA|nr:hypothetical protein Tcan_06191 [Toxocara canis]